MPMQIPGKKTILIADSLQRVSKCLWEFGKDGKWSTSCDYSIKDNEISHDTNECPFCHNRIIFLP